MFYLEKQLTQSSFAQFQQKNSHVLMYQCFHIQPNEWTFIKSKIRGISSTCQWKLSSKHQFKGYDGPLFYVTDDSWDSLQSIYQALQAFDTIVCLGAKYESNWVSLAEMKIIEASTPLTTLSVLSHPHSSLSTVVTSPLISLLTVLTCSLSDLNR